MAKCPTQRCHAKDARVFPKTVQTDWFFVHHPSPKTSSLIWVALEGIFFSCWRFLLLEGIGSGSVHQPGISRCYQWHCNQMGFQAQAKHQKCRFGFAGSPVLFFLDWREQHFVLKKTQRFLVTSGGVLFLNQWTQAKDHHCHKILQK